MPSQAAEQIIAGVVLSERLAVTMYGAIHRAQFSGQRNLRGLVIDTKMLADNPFRRALTDPDAIHAAVELEHACIVPTFAVESNGPDVVVVTRGVGRYVTVQDLISSARARSVQGGKLSLPVAAAIARSVVEALAAAHRAGVVHGAVHPRSVLVDEDGGVRLGDFVVGRALATAVAQGADSSMWRGLSGFLAPEVVVGEDPRESGDVFAAGALLFTMLSGEVPPGTLHVTPAVERLVQRALDTDISRRYKNATDLLENLLEAFEDDRWEIAERGEVIKAAGLSSTDTNIDDATEDLLAALGPSLGTVQASLIRPSMDMRAASIAAQHKRSDTTGAGPNKLEALLQDLDDSREHTAVEDLDRFKRDPISELIAGDPRRRDGARPRVPSLDDDDDETPLPEPRATSPDGITPRPNTRDEVAAMDALSELEGPVKRVESAAEQATAAAVKLEQAAARAEEAVRRSATMKAAPPLLDHPGDFDLPPPKLKSRMFGVIATLALLGGAAGFYMIYRNQQAAKEAQQAERAKKEREAANLQSRLINELPDPGTIRVRSTPSQAGVWLKIGRTPVESQPWSSSMMHELRLEGLEGYQPVDTQVLASHWAGEGAGRKASVSITLQPLARDPKGKAVDGKLPAMPPKPPAATGFQPGRGPIRIDSTPQQAEVWMYVGMTDAVELSGIQAGMPYELRVLKDGHRPAFISITPDEWRAGGDPNIPINVAKKKSVLEKAVTLEIDPNAVAPKDAEKETKKGG